MRVLHVRNVQESLPRGLALMDQIGEHRDSRNGPVLFGGSVSTVYDIPTEKVIFHPDRDANPFFHLYESLWMLAGRDDVTGPARYVKNVSKYSDDGKTFHGAYGKRWRDWFDRNSDRKLDQLEEIAKTLRENKNDRRCVLQMWDAEMDLGKSGADFPCNTMATFQRDKDGRLDLTVFCRSNDIIFGAYGANAVQFGTLLEYMALWVGCPVGTYTQVSVNWHAYDNEVWKQVEKVRPDRVGFVECPYIDRRVHVIPMGLEHDEIDKCILVLLEEADTGFKYHHEPYKNPWADMVYHVLKAHHHYKNDGEFKFTASLNVLDKAVDQKADWIVAAREWILRRQANANKL